MRFFRKIAGMFGFGKDDNHEHNKDEDDDPNPDHTLDNHLDDPNRGRAYVDPIPGPRKGFSVPVKVAVDRPAVGPVLHACSHGDGGVQGLGWYAKRMRIDEDGDVADEFIHEVITEKLAVIQDQQKPSPFPRFEVKHNARHAKVRRQAMTLDGKFQQCVESQGRLQWV